MVQDHGSVSLRVGALLFVVLAISIVGFSIAAKENGIWVDSGAGGCSGSNVCADWDVDGESVFSCCIDPVYIGTDDISACAAAR